MIMPVPKATERVFVPRGYYTTGGLGIIGRVEICRTSKGVWILEKGIPVLLVSVYTLDKHYIDQYTWSDLYFMQRILEKQFGRDPAQRIVRAA
jgi:hypothetical protein